MSSEKTTTFGQAVDDGWAALNQENVMKKMTSAIAMAVAMCMIGATFAQEAGDKTERSKRQRQNQQRRFQRPGGQGQGTNGDRMGRQQRNGGPDMAKMLFQRFDKNQDGFLSEGELPERGKERLAKLDTNGDKKLDANELKAAFASRMGQGGPGGKGMRGEKGQQGKGRKGADGNRPDMAKMLFQRFDKDGDGAISIDEAPERMKERFSQMDANSDSKIDATELKAIAERMRSGQQGKKNNRMGDPEATKPQRPKRPPQSDGDVTT